MPFAAVDDRLAPPARGVVEPAAANDPTVRTVDGLSARKSAGSVEGVVAVAGIPIPSKSCVAGVDVDREMAACTTTARSAATATVQATAVRIRVERMKSFGIAESASNRE
jgi:hypothetical protein